MHGRRNPSSDDVVKKMIQKKKSLYCYPVMHLIKYGSIMSKMFDEVNR